MSDHYAIHQEGHKEAWDHTPGATGEDWGKALAVAQQRAVSQDRNYVVRYNSKEGSRIIVTATPDGEIQWPRYASPVVDLEAGQ